MKSCLQVCFLMLLLGAVGTASSQTLTWAIAAAPQYAEVDVAGEPFGPAYEVTISMVERSGLDIGVAVVPGGRLFEGLASGAYGFVSAPVGPAADAFGTLLTEVFDVPVIAVVAEGARLAGPEDLADLKAIGVARGTLPDLPLLQQLSPQLVELPTTRNGVHMLASGRIDALIASALGIILTARSEGLAQRLGENIRVGDMRLGLYASKGLAYSPAAQQLRRAVEEVVAEGVVEAVAEREYGSNWRSLGRVVHPVP